MGKYKALKILGEEVNWPEGEENVLLMLAKYFEKVNDPNLEDACVITGFFTPKGYLKPDELISFCSVNGGDIPTSFYNKLAPRLKEIFEQGDSSKYPVQIDNFFDENSFKKGDKSLALKRTLNYFEQRPTTYQHFDNVFNIYLDFGNQIEAGGPVCDSKIIKKYHKSAIVIRGIREVAGIENKGEAVGGYGVAYISKEQFRELLYYTILGLRGAEIAHLERLTENIVKNSFKHWQKVTTDKNDFCYNINTIWKENIEARKENPDLKERIKKVLKEGSRDINSNCITETKISPEQYNPGKYWNTI